MADYLYGSARVRALETRLLGNERIGLLSDEKDASGVWERLIEYGIEPLRDHSGAILREETLLGILRRAYAAVCEMLPNDRLLLLWLYPYDCNNVKAAIKGMARGIDPRSMMFDFGTVDIAQTLAMVQKGSFEALPPCMCAAAAEAYSAYARTKDPQTVDLLIDRACYADMLAAAVTNRFVTALVQKKIDLTNLLSLIRILRMRSGEAGKLLLKRAQIEGGTLSENFLCEAYDRGEAYLWDRLRASEYDSFAYRLGTDSSLTAIERQADHTFMKKLKEVKFVPYGAEVITTYLLATECEVRNLRILLAGKEAGLDAATIRERIREGYV